MSIASLFRPAPVALPGGRHAAPETEERPAAPFNPAPGRHAAPDDEPASDAEFDAEFDAAVDAAVDAAFAEDEDLLDALGFDYED
jgi:hypothetical protein